MIGMEKIILEVSESTARKWRQASEEQKERAVDAVNNVLNTPDADALRDMDPEARLREARRFFGSLSADFSNYKFDREEANER